MVSLAYDSGVVNTDGYLAAPPEQTQDV